MITSRRLQTGVNDAQSSSPTAAAALGPLFALAPDPILVSDGDSRFIAANPAALALLGYAEPELLRLTIGDVVAAGPEWARDAFVRFLAHGEWQGEVELRTKSGTAVMVEVNAVVIPGADGPQYVSFLRVLAERNAHEAAQARLAALVRSSPDAVTSVSPDGVFVDWNAAAERLFGYTAEEAIGQPVTMLAPEERVAEAAANLARLIAGEPISGFETVRRRKNGDLVHVALTAAPILDGEGQVVGGLGMFRDITARKRAEADLAAAHQNTQQLLERITDGFFALDAAGRFTYLNQAAEQVLQHSRAELLGKNIYDIFPLTADLEVGHDERRRALAEGRSASVETFSPVLNRWIEAQVYPDAAGYSVFVRNITERKAAEAALRQSEERFRQAFANAVIGMAVVALDGRYLQVNAGLCELTGYDEAELLRKTFHEITHPDDIGADADWDRRLLAGEIPAYQMEKRYLRRDGATVWVRLSVSLIRDDQGEPLHFIEQFEDVTARKSAAEELQASEERYRALFQQAPVMYAQVRDVDGELVIAEANALFLTTLGYERDDVVGRPLLDFYTPEARAAFLAQGGSERPLQRRVAAQERQLLTQGGRVVDVLVWSWPDRSLDGAGTRAAFVDVTERRHAEEALRRSEERFRTTFTHAAIGMALVDLEGRFLQVNPALCALTGYSNAEMMTRTFQEITHPDDLEEDVRQARRLLEGEISSYQMEKRYLRKDGGIAWIRLSGSIVRDARGDPLHYIAQIEDITARKEAEAALAHERDLLQALMDNLPDAVYVKDMSSRFMRINPTAAATLGVADPGQALGKTDFDFFPKELARQFLADEQQVMATGEPLLNRLEPQGVGEDAPWWLTSTVPLRDAAGRIIGVIGSGRDITERLRTEAALRESEARHRALLSALPDLVFRLDRQGTILDYKADHLADLVMPPEAFLGRTVAETLPPHVSAVIMAAIDRVLPDGGIQTVEYALDVPAGRQDFEARLVAVSDDEVVAVVRNVTDRKRVEVELRAAKEAAEEASRLKSGFLSTMSHELRTPLTAITGYAELLRLAGGLSPDQADDIEQIEQSADHLLALVGDVLDLSRLEVGASDLRPGPVTLAAVVEEALAQLAPRAASRGLALGSDVPADLVVEADRRRLRQILLNLVGNAVKFTERGEVRVTAVHHDDGVEVAVSDTGIGIAPAVLPHIFEEFRQAESGVARRYEGAGLGLAIAKKLAEQQGGHISVTSEPGHGSTFTLHLRAASPRQ